MAQCLSPIFDCWSPPKEDFRRCSSRLGERSPRPSLITTRLTNPGVEREMRICHHQPHLVPPMKLVFYEDMPSTPRPPPPSHLSQLVAQGRDLASKATERASLSVRKRPASRPTISAPCAARYSDDLPFRRLPKYRPLELSIYMPDNRLSDLPEFEGIDFTDAGEIQLPPKALLRSKSAELHTHSASSSISRSDSRKATVSMVNDRQMVYWQRNRSSSVVSTSRPPSAHDAFHSHPVAFSTLPGLHPPPPQHQHTRSDTVTILTPMQEEFTPTSTHHPETIEFPRVEDHVSTLVGVQATTPDSAQLPRDPASTESTVEPPLKLSAPPTTRSGRSHSHTSSFQRRRISQWVTRTPSDTLTHDQKKAQFYQCAVTPPQPQPQPQHARNRTMSSSTVATSILTDPESMTSDTTAPTDIRSRTGTIRSIPQKQVIVVVEEDLPPAYIDNMIATQEPIAPVIGMAF